MYRHKFRAWDKKNNEIINASHWIVKELSEIDKRYKVMQYTGHEDIKEKEIYEGDIIEQTVNGQVYSITVVEWNKKRSMFEFVDNASGYATHYFPLDQYQGEFRIIGNIYENPELIVEKEKE